mgnify:CR=1 FL=1
MGRLQSKTLPNWGEFLIGLGVYEEKRNCLPAGADIVDEAVISTEGFKSYQGKPVKQDSWWKVPGTDSMQAAPGDCQ